MLPKEKLVFYQHVHPLKLLSKKRRTSAASLTETVLAGWLARQYPMLSASGLRQDKELARHSKIQAFVRWLAAQDVLDSAFWLSSAYATWVGEKRRRQRAMFFTPPALSKRLIDDLTVAGADFERGVFIDPACGGAAFLAPVAIKMRERLAAKGLKSKAILKHVYSHLIGSDLNPTLCKLSSFFLKAALYDDIVNAQYEPRFNVRTGNAFAELAKRDGQFDVVLCNPPYRRMQTYEIKKYKRRFEAVIQGQSNLYGLFFSLALRLIKPGGIAGLLTPTSFLSGKHFSKLRTYMLAHANASQIDIISDRVGVFVGVEQETAISIFQKKSNNTVAKKHTRVFALAKPNRFIELGTSRLPTSGLAWPVPRTTGDVETIRVVNGSKFRLFNYGYEPRIGAFVWNRDRRRKYHDEKRARKKAKAPFPLIWSSDVSQSGHFEFNRHKNGEYHAFVDMRRLDHPSVIRRPCVALQRVTSNDQRRRLVAAPVGQKFIEEHGGVVGENHVVFLEKTGKNPVLAPAQLAKVLRSDPIDRLFRCISGANNVSIFELSQVPMPEPHALAAELKRKGGINAAVLRAFRSRTKD